MTAVPDEAMQGQVPVPGVGSEDLEDGRVVLVRPKILSPRWAWVLRFLGRPAYRVRLDALGSAAWRACDGVRTVAQVAEAVAAAHPDAADPLPRTVAFIRELARGGFISLGSGDSRQG